MDLMAGKVRVEFQEEGIVPDRLLLYKARICRFGQPEPPQALGRLPDRLLLDRVKDLQPKVL